VISGGPASHLSPRRTAEVAEAIAGAEFVTIEAGHRVHSIAPDDFHAVVVPFLSLCDR
jgi:pimeloyl-ACP methyl ester carboxylesterase